MELYNGSQIVDNLLDFTDTIGKFAQKVTPEQAKEYKDYFLRNGFIASESDSWFFSKGVEKASYCSTTGMFVFHMPPDHIIKGVETEIEKVSNKRFYVFVDEQGYDEEDGNGGGTCYLDIYETEEEIDEHDNEQIRKIWDDIAHNVWFKKIGTATVVFTSNGDLDTISHAELDSVEIVALYPAL